MCPKCSNKNLKEEEVFIFCNIFNIKYKKKNNFIDFHVDDKSDIEKISQKVWGEDLWKSNKKYLRKTEIVLLSPFVCLSNLWRLYILHLMV